MALAMTLAVLAAGWWFAQHAWDAALATVWAD